MINAAGNNINFQSVRYSIALSDVRAFSLYVLCIWTIKMLLKRFIH